MTEPLFDVEHPALVYSWPGAVEVLSKLRCRECHKSGPYSGGGLTRERFAYAICDHCFRDDGELGERARTGGWEGWPVIIIESTEGEA